MKAIVTSMAYKGATGGARDTCGLFAITVGSRDPCVIVVGAGVVGASERNN